MARFTRVEVINAMYELGLVPVFYHGDLEMAKKIVNACVDGGARVVEFTNRGDRAYQIFSELVGYFSEERPEVILGVGSILDPSTASLYVDTGANFVVGPILNGEVAKACNRRKIPYSPGCGSASEISEAESLGVEIVKIFPGGQVGGPAFVKAILAPMPWTRIMPTGGVDSTRESIRDWIQAGAACLGMGSKLITKDKVAEGDWAGITAKVEECLWWIKEARGESPFSGIEHVGLYPGTDDEAKKVANWYAQTFGFELVEGKRSVFGRCSGPGWIEIMRKAEQEKAHIAIKVHNFDAACEALREKGLELEEARIIENVKLADLERRDPAGYRVQIIYRP
jgi:2-dehydro-3-deoxyphosphogluconate aldolase/(4S)-4-hydroxy-2-oxoglutarate aldolase